MKVEKLLKNICKYSGSIKYGTDEETFTKKAIANLQLFDKFMIACSTKMNDVFVFRKIYLRKFFLQAFLPLKYTNADLKICQYLRLHMKAIC